MSIFRASGTVEHSIIDPVKPTLDPRIVINDKINSSLREKILDAVEYITKKNKIAVEHTWVIGSSLTNQWRDDSDIDVTVLVKGDPDDLTALNKDVATEYNEQLFFDKHPINFHFAPARFKKFKADAIYDLDKDKWIKEPNFLSEEYVSNLIEKCSTAEEFTHAVGEYKKFQRLLKDFTGEEGQIEEILKQAFEVLQLFKEARDLRREDYEKKSEDGLPSASHRPPNVVFKLMEAYGLGEIKEELASFFEKRLKN